MKRSLVIASSAILLFAAACGAQSQEKPKISDGVVKIGMIEDMSSIYADITGLGAVTAAKMAVEDFGGTVLGMPIEVVSADHQNKADIASATAREWFENQHVDALMDVAASATALAAIDIAKTKNKIAVLNGPGAARITNEACTPISIHYTYDNYALAHGTGGAMVKAGYDTWFFVAADYAFGHDLEQVTAGVVKANGGQVLGGVRVPINTSDFSSALLQAQSSKAKVIGLANAGADTQNSIKQAAEFGIVRGGQKLGGLLVFINDVNSLGLEVAQGMLLTTAFYWDRNDESRAWAQRFFQRMNRSRTWFRRESIPRPRIISGRWPPPALTTPMPSWPRCGRPRSTISSPRTGRSAKMAGWFTTCICTRSRSRRNPNERGITTSPWRKFLRIRRSCHWLIQGVRW
jgi:branched-chain amino acid transport system substrate-binding protein